MSDGRMGREALGTADAPIADPPVQTSPAAPRSLGANLLSLATSQAITWVLALLWTFVVPRSIGPEGIGLLGIATSVTAIAAVIVTHPPKDYLVREFTRSPQDAPRLMATALALRLAALPPLALASVGYGLLAQLDALAMTIMYLMLGATACAMLLEPALAIFQARQQMQFMAYTDVSNKFLQTIGGVLLALAGFGVVAITGFSLAVAVVTLMLALSWAHRMIRLGARPHSVARLLRGGMPYWVVAVFFVGYLWVDGLIMGLLVPTEEVGWYAAATRLFRTMMFVAVIIATAALPRLIAAHEEGDRRLKQAVANPLVWTVALGLPIGIGMASIANDLVPVLYGDQYSGAIPALAILGLCVPVMYVNIVVAQVFVASGRPSVLAWLLALATAVNVTLNVLLVPWTHLHWGNGAIGAALSMLLTEVVQAGLGLFLARRWVLSRSIMVRLGAAGLASAVMAGFLWVLDPAPLAVQVALGGCVFIMSAVVMRVPSEADLQKARDVVARVGGRSGRNGTDR